MRYAILLYDDEGEATPSAAALAAGGLLVGGERLLPPRAATTVRARGGSPAIAPGPCGDGPHPAAVLVIEAPGLDDAIAWADGVLGGAGAAEIRPCAGLSIPRPADRPLDDPDLEEPPCST